MERIEFETELRLWRSTPGGAAGGIIHITGEPADAIRIAALTGQWGDGIKKSRKSARVMSTIGNTRWKNSVFPDEETGGWVMPVNQATRVAESIAEGDRIRVVIEL
ncbi:MAG: DUF1905 domain-containing protein [Novosphingobium sp.]|nr:DUF1905 domain-containing protein [Novosphingobium sp.]